MPLYEYRCTSCRREFEELVFDKSTPDCPHCGASAPEKLLSAHAVGSGRPEVVPGPCGPCGHPAGPGACRFD